MWPWETAATLPSALRRKALRRPRGRRGAGHIVAAARLQLVIIIKCFNETQNSGFAIRFRTTKPLNISFHLFDHPCTYKGPASVAQVTETQCTPTGTVCRRSRGSILLVGR